METDLDRPSYTGSPTELWQFTQGLEDWLPRQSANLRSTIIDGSATVKGKTIVLSPTHARMIKANLVVQADGTAYNTRVPAPCNIADYDPASHPHLIPARIMSADGLTVVKDFTNELTDLEKLEFACEPGTLKNLNLELGKLVLECIQSKADRKDRDKDSAGRGTILLAQIAQDSVDNMDPELACGLATDLNDALDAGYAEATVVSFNTWRDMCETQNNAIPVALGKLTDTLLAGKYALATSALNGEVRSDLKHAMKAAHAAGNLARTVTCIKEALASAEAAAKDVARRKSKMGRDGRALLAATSESVANDAALVTAARALLAAQAKGDAKKTTLPPFDPSTLTAEQLAKRPKIDGDGKKYWHELMGDCRHCKGRGHLNADCPKLKSNGGTIVPPPYKKGKANLAAGEQSDEEEGDEEAAMALFAGGSKMIQLEAIMDPDALLNELKIQEEAAVTASTQPTQGFGRTTGHAAMARGTHAATMPLRDVQPDSDEEDEPPELQPVQSDSNDEEDDDVEDEDEDSYSPSIPADDDVDMSSLPDLPCSVCDGDETRVTLSCGNRCATLKALSVRVEGSTTEGLCQSCGSLTKHQCTGCLNEWYCSEACQQYDECAHHFRTLEKCGKNRTDSVPSAIAEPPATKERKGVYVVTGSPLNDNGIYYGARADVEQHRRRNASVGRELDANTINDTEWSEHLEAHAAKQFQSLLMAAEHCSLVADPGVWHGPHVAWPIPGLVLKMSSVQAVGGSPETHMNRRASLYTVAALEVENYHDLHPYDADNGPGLTALIMDTAETAGERVDAERGRYGYDTVMAMTAAIHQREFNGDDKVRTGKTLFMTDEAVSHYYEVSLELLAKFKSRLIQYLQPVIMCMGRLGFTKIRLNSAGMLLQRPTAGLRANDGEEPPPPPPDEDPPPTGYDNEKMMSALVTIYRISAMFANAPNALPNLGNKARRGPKTIYPPKRMRDGISGAPELCRDEHGVASQHVMIQAGTDYAYDRATIPLTGPVELVEAGIALRNMLAHALQLRMAAFPEEGEHKSIMFLGATMVPNYTQARATAIELGPLMLPQDQLPLPHQMSASLRASGNVFWEREATGAAASAPPSPPPGGAPWMWHVSIGHCIAQAITKCCAGFTTTSSANGAGTHLARAHAPSAVANLHTPPPGGARPTRPV